MQRVSQKCTLHRSALAKVWLFISYTKINLPNYILNILICKIMSFTKICLLSHCLFCLKQFDAYVEKVRFFKHNFFKIFRPLQFLNNFYYCFKAPAKTNTIFNYREKCAGRLFDHKYFSNFFGTVPTFGFRISIVENVRSQNFY